jgi:hypothetical protein
MHNVQKVNNYINIPYHPHKLLDLTYFSLHTIVPRPSVMIRSKAYSVATIHIKKTYRSMEAKLQAFLLILVLHGGQLSKCKAADKTNRNACDSPRDWQADSLVHSTRLLRCDRSAQKFSTKLMGLPLDYLGELNSIRLMCSRSNPWLYWMGYPGSNL